MTARVAVVRIALQIEALPIAAHETATAFGTHDRTAASDDPAQHRPQEHPRAHAHREPPGAGGVAAGGADGAGATGAAGAGAGGAGGVAGAAGAALVAAGATGALRPADAFAAGAGAAAPGAA